MERASVRWRDAGVRPMANESQSGKETLASMWIWSVRRKPGYQVRFAQKRLGDDRDGESMEALRVPLPFVQVHGGPIQVKRRWETYRAALLENRKARVDVKEGDALEDALKATLDLLEQNHYPAALAAEEAFQRHGLTITESGRIEETCEGRRGRRADLVAIAIRYARTRMVKEGRLPKTSRMGPDVRSLIREDLSGLFEAEALTDDKIKGALTSLLYPARHGVSK